jgi:hypothetical protein
MLLGHRYGFFAGYDVQCGFIEIQVSGDEFGRSVREPLGKRHPVVKYRGSRGQQWIVVRAGVDLSMAQP